jgi:type IV pilus assembly protein PilN
MIKINLLPQEEIKAYVDIKREIALVILSYIFIIFVLFYTFNNLHTRQKVLRAKVKTVNMETQKYKSIEEKLKTLKKKKRIIEEKIQIVSNLEKSRKKLLAILDTISENFLVDKMWLEELEIEDNKVHIKGVALGNESIAEFMKRLETTPLFQKVDLIKTQKEKVQQINLTSFELECKILYHPTQKGKNARKN